MNMRLSGIALLLTLPAFIAGCATVGSQAPMELKEAQTAIDAAKKADVEDYMPSAMEAATRKLDKSVAMLDDASDYKDEGVDGQAKGTRDQAIELANEAKAIAVGATKIVADLRSYDSNSGAYLSAADRGARAAELEKELAASKAAQAEMEARYSTLTAENQALANRPVEEGIPADFSVGKPVAYFATGSTTLNSKYRPDVKELAQLLKSNPGLFVTLEGFADPRGSVALNQRLAEKRVEVVATELRNNGVAQDKMKLVTVGATADASAARGARGGELQLDRKVTATITTAAH